MQEGEKGRAGFGKNCPSPDSGARIQKSPGRENTARDGELYSSQ